MCRRGTFILVLLEVKGAMDLIVGQRSSRYFFVKSHVLLEILRIKMPQQC